MGIIRPVSPSDRAWAADRGARGGAGLRRRWLLLGSWAYPAWSKRV